MRTVQERVPAADGHSVYFFFEGVINDFFERTLEPEEEEEDENEAEKEFSFTLEFFKVRTRTRTWVGVGFRSQRTDSRQTTVTLESPTVRTSSHDRVVRSE